jgi:hypothetical protein
VLAGATARRDRGVLLDTLLVRTVLAQAQPPYDRRACLVAVPPALAGALVQSLELPAECEAGRSC